MKILEKIKNLPTLNELKGGFGEQLAKYFCNIVTDALILHDVLIDGAQGLTSQIDMVMIDRKGIYVVEVKMYNEAKIYGDGKKKQWYYYKNGSKYSIYSPLMQNRKHVLYLKDFLKEFGEIPFFSVVTIICEDFKITNINSDTDHPDTVVCSSLPAMKRAIDMLSKDKPDTLNSEQRQKIYNYIENNQYKGKQVRNEHVAKIKEMNEKKGDAINNKNCPYCNKALILRKGKYGDFYGCENYPQCRYTQKIDV